MTIEMYPSDQVADLRAEVTHWYENLQKEQINQQAQLQEFGQSSRKGDFPGELFLPGDFAFTALMFVGLFFFPLDIPVKQAFRFIFFSFSSN